MLPWGRHRIIPPGLAQGNLLYLSVGRRIGELCAQFSELLAGGVGWGGIGTDSSLAPLFQLTFHSFTSGTYPIYQKRRLTPPTPASLLGVHILQVQRPLLIACGYSSYSREKMASGPAAAGSLQNSASHPRAKAAALRCRTRAQLLNLSVITQLLHLPQGLVCSWNL